MERYLAITGGVGGAKLALGLSRALSPEQIMFAVNTGDDFEHLGWQISPDIDTLTYTLAGLSNQGVGWGREDESWAFMNTLEELGGETWFRLGDKDLALHTYRTQRLGTGATLTEVTAEISRKLGIRHRILPMSDQPVRTTVNTPEGPLAFQHYFVRDRCKPTVTGFEFSGIKSATLNPAIATALDGLSGIIICPSNPFVSVDPMLEIPGVRDLLSSADTPVVAVSPIVGGSAIKGPTAKMMAELNVPATATQVAAHYGELLDGFVLDQVDEDLHDTLSMPTVVTQTVMITLQDRVDLARKTLEFIKTLQGTSD